MKDKLKGLSDEDLKYANSIATCMLNQAKGDKQYKYSMYILGLLHTLGDKIGSDFYAELLDSFDFPYVIEVEEQGDPNSYNRSVELDLLNKAKLQIDKSGNYVGYTKKLKELESDYGVDSEEYQNAIHFVKAFTKKRLKITDNYTNSLKDFMNYKKESEDRALLLGCNLEKLTKSYSFTVNNYPFRLDFYYDPVRLYQRVYGVLNLLNINMIFDACILDISDCENIKKVNLCSPDNILDIKKGHSGVSRIEMMEFKTANEDSNIVYLSREGQEDFPYTTYIYGCSWDD